MKSKIYMIAALCLHSFTYNFAQNFEWVRNMGSMNYYDFGHGVSVDDKGNVYSTGSYYGYADFDPNIPGSELDSFGLFNFFIQKHDGFGNFLWAKGIGGQGNDYAFSIKNDRDGNVYTTGYFRNTVDFDPGPGEFYLTAPNDSPGPQDVFIQKLDTDGNFIWALSLGHASGGGDGYAIELDENDNIYVAGIFSGTVDFDPGPAEFNLTGQGDQDAFILKLNSDGNFLWAKRIGGAGYDSFLCLTPDPATGGIVLGGYFERGGVDLDPGDGVLILDNNPYPNDAYAHGVILKLDSNGNLVWVKALFAKYRGSVSGIDIDQFGNIYATGPYKDSIDLDPGLGTFYPPRDNDVNYSDKFIIKLSPAGNLMWATSTVGQYDEIGVGLKVDNAGNVYSTGSFGWIFGPAYQVDFDPGPGVFNLQCQNGIDAFIEKLDTDGNFVWAHKISGVSSTSLEEGNGILLDEYANIYVVGNSRGGDYDPGPGMVGTPTFSGQIFILKWSQCQPTSSELVISTCSSYTLNGQTYTESGTYFQIEPNGFGCYTYVTLHLTINQPGATVTLENGTLTANTAGALYQWVDCNQNFASIPGQNGQSFTPTVSGSYAVLIAQNNCASFSDCYFVCPPTAAALEITSCEPYILNGETFTESGIYTQNLTNSNGCDSILTLNLTIIPVDASVTQEALTLTANTAGAIYQWVDCNQNFAPIPGATAQSFTPAVSGSFAVVVTQNNCANTSDCYAICLATSGTLEITSCEDYVLNGETYTESGVYIQNLTNSSGCDSILTLNLTIATVDATVTQEATTLTANAPGAQYQWVDCNQTFEPIPGETGQSFTPAASGEYAVVVIQDGCPAISECYSVTIVGTEETLPEAAWQLYPNPTGGQLSIVVPEGEIDGIFLAISNPLGQLVHQETASNTKILNLQLDLPAGVYAATIKSGNRQKTISFVVQ